MPPWSSQRQDLLRRDTVRKHFLDAVIISTASGHMCAARLLQGPWGHHSCSMHRAPDSLGEQEL